MHELPQADLYHHQQPIFWACIFELKGSKCNIKSLNFQMIS